jgi:predicted phage-related endonuclease
MVGGEKETDVLKQKYPDAIGEINLHPKALEYVTKRREADKVIKEYEKIKDSADNELRLLMGEFEIGYIGDIKIRYPKISKELIDIKKLKQEMPEIYKKYIYKSESRRLYI